MIQVKNINIKDIPKKPGIYFWYAKNNDLQKIAKALGINIKGKSICIYIGKSKNLYIRFRKHIKIGYNAPRTSTFSWTLRSLLGNNANSVIQNLYYEFEVTDNIEQAEKEAIDKFKPLLNLDECVNEYETLITSKRKQYKQEHSDIWKK